MANAPAMLRNALLIAALALAGCSAPPTTSPTATMTTVASPSATATQAAEPNKESAATALGDLAKAMAAKDYPAARQVLVLPEGATDEQLDAELAKMAEREEISEAGVKKLIEEGKFGPAKEIFPEQADGWAERAKVKVDDCYAFSLDPAEAMLHWDGSGFKILRFDDIGKL